MAKIISSTKRPAKNPPAPVLDWATWDHLPHVGTARPAANDLASGASLEVGEMLATRNVSQTPANPGNWLELLDLDCVPMAAAYEVDAVRNWLIACSAYRMIDAPYTLYRYSNGDASDGFFGTATWQARAFAAYKLIRHAIADADRTKLDGWFLGEARFHVGHMDDVSGLGGQFPNRVAGDYSVRGVHALSGAMDIFKAHADAPQVLSVLSLVYNNRRAVCMFLGLIVGVYFNDAPLLASVKRYVKEWVTYSVYEDGSQGDWRRNESNRITYGYNSGGVTYSSYCNALALIAARWLADMGDDELLTFRTRDGLHGTQSTKPKSIFTPLETHLAIFDGTLVFKDSTGLAMNQRVTPYGYLNHISWVLPAVRRDGRYADLAKMVRRSPKIINEACGAWRGMAGAWLDTRLQDLPPTLPT